jgi:putative two-component system response regulator
MENNEPTILIVDDAKTNIDILLALLGDDYDLAVAMGGESALSIVEEDPPDLILLDVMMPGMDGYEVCRRLKANPSTRNIPVIFVTAMSEVADETKGFEIGAVDYITKPISPPIIEARVKTHLALYDQNRVLDEKVRLRTAELNATRLDVIRRLGTAAEYKDNETGLHVVRMSYYAQLISRAAGFSEEHAEIVFIAAPMHDIGKIGIPDHILRKPGELDNQEWETMKKHTTIGVEILGDQESELMDMARLIALTHHEKWNGTGYPHGLSGEDIPIEGRVVSLADVFDALTSDRPYKKAWPVEDAVALINKESGEQFDPRLVIGFNKALPEILEVRDTYSERN